MTINKKRTKVPSPIAKSSQPSAQRFKQTRSIMDKKEADRKKAELIRKENLLNKDKKAPTRKSASRVGFVPQTTTALENKNKNNNNTTSTSNDDSEVEIIGVKHRKPKMTQPGYSESSEEEFTPVKSSKKRVPRVSLDGNQNINHHSSGSTSASNSDSEDSAEQIMTDEAINEELRQNAITNESIDAMIQENTVRRSARNLAKQERQNRFQLLDDDDDDEEEHTTNDDEGSVVAQDTEDEEEEDNNKDNDNDNKNNDEKDEDEDGQGSDTGVNGGYVDDDENMMETDETEDMLEDRGNTNVRFAVENEDEEDDEIIQGENLAARFQSVSDDQETTPADGAESSGKGKDEAKKTKSKKSKKGKATFAEVEAAAMNAPPPSDELPGFLDLRLPLQVRTPADDFPLVAFSTIVSDVLITIQKAIHKNVGIAVWDSEDYMVAPITNVNNLPTGEGIEDARIMGNMFSTYVNPRSDSDTNRANLKIRLMWNRCTRITIPIKDWHTAINNALKKMGIPATFKQPYPCQCASWESPGWLLYSTRTMVSDALEESVRKILKIPPHVEMGFTWRAIRDRNKKPYPWNKDYPSPQALHIEIDTCYALQYGPKFSNLWKKNGSCRPNGLQLRLVPEIGSYAAAAATTEARDEIVSMAFRQQYFNNECLQKQDTPFIANLDYPDPQYVGDKDYTLRVWLMSQTVEGSFTQRAIHSVDAHWRDSGSHTTTTTKPNTQAGMHVLSVMVPYALKYHPAAAKHWFTPKAMEIFKGASYDPVSKTTVSKASRDILRLADENLWGIDDGWKKLLPENEKNLLPDTANGKQPDRGTAPKQSRSLAVMDDADEVESFGGMFGRDRSDASIAADARQAPPERETAIDWDKTVLDREVDAEGDERSLGSLSQSTAGQTTNSTRYKLQATKEAHKKTMEECEQLPKSQEELKEERDILAKQLEDDQEAASQMLLKQQQEIEDLRKAMRRMKRVSANKTATDTGADGVGSNT